MVCRRHFWYRSQVPFARLSCPCLSSVSDAEVFTAARFSIAHGSSCTTQPPRMDPDGEITLSLQIVEVLLKYQARALKASILSPTPLLSLSPSFLSHFSSPSISLLEI
jgi:hypothetical protein